jgi:hypothetical protein
VAWSVISALKDRRDLALENVALRHHLMVLGRQPGRVRFKDRDRLSWVWLRRAWPGRLERMPVKSTRWTREGRSRDWFGSMSGKTWISFFRAMARVAPTPVRTS